MRFASRVSLSYTGQDLLLLPWRASDEDVKDADSATHHLQVRRCETQLQSHAVFWNCHHLSDPQSENDYEMCHSSDISTNKHLTSIAVLTICLISKKCESQILSLINSVCMWCSISFSKKKHENKVFQCCFHVNILGKRIFLRGPEHPGGDLKRNISQFKQD